MGNSLCRVRRDPKVRRVRMDPSPTVSGGFVYFALPRLALCNGPGFPWVPKAPWVPSIPSVPRIPTYGIKGS